jgi:hypothetical protein
VHIVIDHAGDPVWDVVSAALAGGHPNRAVCHVEALTDIGRQCSLKVSAQRQAISRLGKQVEVVTLIDADSIPAPGWLRCMVAPLADPNVGAASGIRWFAPPDNGWGTWIRHLTNAACFMNMYVFHIPWGGSLAIRREVIERAGLLDHWATCFCEDVSAHGPISKLGLRIEFVPAATQFNREMTDGPGAYRFILRQFLCARLHHASWPAILAFNLLNMTALLGLTAIAMTGVATGNWMLAAGAGVAPAVYLTGMLLGLQAAEISLRRHVTDPPPVGRGWASWAAIVPTLAVSLVALLATPFVRNVDWRGVRYDLLGRGRIRLREYRPYEATPAEAGHSVI